VTKTLPSFFPPQRGADKIILEDKVRPDWSPCPSPLPFLPPPLALLGAHLLILSQEILVARVILVRRLLCSPSYLPLSLLDTRAAPEGEHEDEARIQGSRGEFLPSPFFSRAHEARRIDNKMRGARKAGRSVLVRPFLHPLFYEASPSSIAVTRSISNEQEKVEAHKLLHPPIPPFFLFPFPPLLTRASRKR